jgi:hypothetical protein
MQIICLGRMVASVVFHKASANDLLGPWQNNWINLDTVNIH